MKRIGWIASCLGVFLSLVSGSFGSSESRVQMEPAYVEQTNGLFAVCAFDRTKRVLLKYKGVVISKAQLPLVRMTHPNFVFALGTRPNMVSNVPPVWQSRQEDLYHYGEIPYSIEEIDPSFELCKTETSEVVVGIRLQSRFYAVENLGKLEHVQGVKLPFYEAKGRLHVLSIQMPKHRENEVKDIIRTLKAGVAGQISTNDNLSGGQGGR